MHYYNITELMLSYNRINKNVNVERNLSNYTAKSDVREA